MSSVFAKPFVDRDSLDDVAGVIFDTKIRMMLYRRFVPKVAGCDYLAVVAAASMAQTSSATGIAPVAIISPLTMKVG
ncbi:MAG: hypothetical protein U0103_29140, partial [Candidatus Obscuribacterales bacterium]